MRSILIGIISFALFLSAVIKADGYSLSDPITGNREFQNKLDSTLTQDSIRQVKLVKETLTRARSALNDDNLDSALIYADVIISSDNNIIPPEFITEAFFIAGKANRIKGKQEEALRFYLKTIQKLKLVNGFGCQSEVNQELALMYYQNGLVNRAIEKYEDAYNIEVKKNNTNEQIRLLKKIIKISGSKNDLVQTVTYQEKLLKLYDFLNPSERMKLMQNLSDNYIELKKYQSAINLQVQIMEFEKREHNIPGQFETLLNMIRTYYEKRDPESFFKRGIYVFNYLFQMLPEDRITPQLTNLKARELVYQGKYFEIFGDTHHEDYATAIQLFDSAQMFYKFTGNEDGLVESKLNLARIFLKSGDYHSSADNLLAAISLISHKKDYSALIQAYQMLGEAYEKMDKYKSAYQANLQLLEYKDSLYSQQQSLEISSRTGKYEKNSESTFFQNLERSYIQEELDTLSEALLRRDIENYRKDIALLLAEKKLQQATILNQQLEQKKNTQEIELYKQNFLAEKHQNEIARLQNEMKQNELDLKNKQLEQKSKEQQINALEQEKRLNDINLQKSEARRYVLLLSIAIIFIVLIFSVAGYINVRKSKEHIVAQNKLIEIKNSKLQELNKEKNRLIRAVAHDLKNPLSSALTLADLIMNKPRQLSESQIHSFTLIRLSMRRMYEMIIKILDTKAIDEEKINIEYEAVNLHQVVEHIIDLFQEKANEKKIRIIPETTEIYAKVDHGYLFQILENLISNALKFSPSGTNVYIKTVDIGNKSRVIVKDEGPGFKEEEMKNLFIKFRQYSASATKGEIGSGLGLSLVKKYVDIMGGRVWCESIPGQGASFMIEFEKALVTV